MPQKNIIMSVIENITWNRKNQVLTITGKQPLEGALASWVPDTELMDITVSIPNIEDFEHARSVASAFAQQNGDGKMKLTSDIVIEE